MNPKNLKYAETHQWVTISGGVATVGITDHAQAELGDITFLELPEVGKDVAQGAELAVIESVKAASDIIAPIAGKVSAVNTALDEDPEIINEDPYGKGWVCQLADYDESGLDALMTAEEYEKFLEE